MYPCWPGLLSTNAAAVDMLSRLSERFNQLVCGVLPTDGAVVDSGRLISPLLFASGRSAEQPGCLSSPSVVEFTRETDGDAEAELPCLAFGSEDGFQVFSFAENRMRSDDVVMRLSRGSRHVPSPHGGKVFVTDMWGRHQCHLVDPFTGERTPLPDLPIPLSEEEPMPAMIGTDRSEPRYRLSTDDGFAWDWSPRGVMVARGDTAFFCRTGAGDWTPVHRSSHGSAMTVNYRGGFFFVLELGSLRTAVIDAETLDHSAEIDPPPRRGGKVHLAFLVTSTDNVLLLVSHDGYRSTFTHAYRAHRPRQDGPIQWEPVKNIGDRAVFVDGAHGFTVRAGGRVRKNCVYVPKTVELDDGEHGDMARVVTVSPLNNLRKVKVAEGGEALRRCKVKPVWGISHWIISNHGPSP
ncbi:hypothetical protein VPH35_127524 [Triticum aestivum]